MNDPYTILGIGRDASQDAVKKAYRRLAKELHPDLNPGDKIVEQRFKEVSAAYRLLSDPKTRAQYDRGEINADGSPRFESAFRRAYSGAGAGAAGGRGPFEFSFGGSADFEDLFSDLFGRGRRSGGRSARAKGKDVRYDLEVPFEEAVRGSKRRVTLHDGKSLEVSIPPGTEDGQTLRLRGQGFAGLGGGSAGDALVVVSVKPHRHFRREGRDIHLDVPVTIDEAVLGAKISVPIIDGKVTLTIPPGSNTGTRLRLKGKGIPGPRGAAGGDQYVHLQVVLPEKPDEGFRDFIRSWREDHGYEVRRKHGLD